MAALPLVLGRALPLVLGGVSAAASLGGGAVGLLGSNIAASGSVAAGRDALAAARYDARTGKYLAKFEAKQLERQAREAEGDAAVKARERLHDAKLLQSTALARAAASGGGATNPTVLNIMEDIEQRGAFLAETEHIAGRHAAKSLRHQAAATILEADLAAPLILARGRSALAAGQYAASGQRLAGIGSLIGGVGNAASSFSAGYARYR